MNTKNSNVDVKYIFKYAGLVLILIPFLVLMFNEDYFFFRYDINIVMKILFFTLAVIGAFYIILIDTSFFKFKPLSSLIISRLNTTSFKIEVSHNDKIIHLSHKKKCAKHNNTQFEFKPLDELGSIVRDSTILNEDSKEILMKILEKIRVESKIPIISVNDKNIFIYSPMFDFLDKITDGGIRVLYGKSRRDLFNFITMHFTRNGADFVKDNLRKRYHDWIKREIPNSDIFLALDDFIYLSSPL